MCVKTRNAVALPTIFSFFLSLVSATVFSQTTIEGFGSQVTGGAGQTVVYVTNLNATGPGSLHAAMGSNRYIRFDGLSGTITGFRWDSSNEGAVSNVTIDGTTADAPGITLDNNNNGNGLSFQTGCHNIIVKNIRVRNAGNDCINVVGGYDIVFDHVSVSGGRDGNLDISQGAYNVTVQWSIIGNGGSGSWSGCMLIAYTPTKDISVHHNFFSSVTNQGGTSVGERIPFVHQNNTSPSSTNLMCHFVNNLVWRWGRQNGTGAGFASGVDYDGSLMCENNYYYSNASTTAAISIDPDPFAGSGGQCYAAGNFSGNAYDPNGGGVSNHAAWTIPSSAQITMQPACEAATLVIANAGCQPLDATDQGFIGQATLPECPLLVSVKTFLQGAYNTTLARHKDVSATWASVLNANALNQPYNASAYGTYAGTESVSSGFFTSTAATTDIVDWVLLELRDATTPSTIVARRAAFIREDGQVVDLNGSQEVTFNGVSPGNYYIAVKHRNHLGVRTSSTQAINSISATAYDFTTAQNQAYQNSGIATNNAMKDLGSGVFIMWAGDATIDARTNASGSGNDYSYLVNTVLGGNVALIISNVYHTADMNMDGAVRASGTPALNDYIFLVNTVLLGNITAVVDQHL